MFCSNCGKKLEDGWIKCPYCSAEVKMQYRNKNEQTEVNEKNDESTGGYHIVLGNDPPIVKKYLGWGMKTLRIIAMFIIAVLIIIGPFTVSSFGTTIDFLIALVQYYSMVVFIVVVPVLLIFNTRGIRDKLPLFKKRKAPTTLLAILLTYISLSIVLGIILDGSDLLHTKAYHDEIQEQTLAVKKAEEEEILAKEQEQIAKKTAEEEKAKKAAEKEAAKKAAAEEEAAKKAAEEEAAAKKAAEEEAARKTAEDEKNHIPTQLEQIQSSIDAAKGVELEELLRSPSQYENKNVGVTDRSFTYYDGNPYFYSGGEIVVIYPRIKVDEQGNSVENLLDYDKIAVVGDFHFHNSSDGFGTATSSINNAIVILLDE